MQSQKAEKWLENKEIGLMLIERAVQTEIGVNDYARVLLVARNEDPEGRDEEWNGLTLVQKADAPTEGL